MTDNYIHPGNKLHKIIYKTLISVTKNVKQKKNYRMYSDSM